VILNDPVLRRMVWKEYRAQRNFWLSIAGFGVALMLLVNALLGPTNGFSSEMWMIAISLPVIYVLGSAAVTLAAEREDGTLELLRNLAARPSGVFLGKFGFILISTLALLGFLLLTALGVTGGVPPHLVGRNENLLSDGLATAMLAVQALAWGCLFSAICSKALTAVSISAIVPVALLTIQLQMHADPRDGWWWAQGLALAVPCFLISYFLTRRALGGRSGLWAAGAMGRRVPDRNIRHAAPARACPPDAAFEAGAFSVEKGTRRVPGGAR
jgi:hypothetical protein